MELPTFHLENMADALLKLSEAIKKLSSTGRYAETHFDGEGWNVILFDSVEADGKILDFAKSQQIFVRFDDPQKQLYIYRWCLEGVVTL